MKLLKLAALVALMAFGAAVAQEVEKKVELRVVVSGDGEGKDIHWVSRGGDLNLDDLEVGESKTITGESGEDVTVTRTDDGMQIEIDGETVVIPAMGGHGTHMAFVSADGEVVDMSGDDVDVDVRVIGDDEHVVRAHHPDGITIISDTTLDDAVRESIRSVLISAGHEDDVTFIDGGDHGKRVKIIRKRVEVNQ